MKKNNSNHMMKKKKLTQDNIRSAEVYENKTKMQAYRQY